MKLVNHTLSYLSITFLIVLAIWSSIFYINFLDEIYDSIDDGLENAKMLILEKAQNDSTVIRKNEFRESNYAIREIATDRAIRYRDIYMDTSMFMINEQDYEPVRIHKSAFRAHNGKYYELLVMSSMVEEDDLIEDLLYSIIWLYVILLVTIVVINNVVLRRIWKPFYFILDRLKNFRIENPQNVRVPSTQVTEFKMLDDSVNELIQRTVSSFNNQKQFIENASHELQTPLASSINRLELMSEKYSSSEQLTQELGAVIQSLQRLTRLNKTLLLLSKIENSQFPEQSEVNFNTLVNQLITEFSDIAEFKSVTLTAEHNGELTRKMNPELATILISNLIKNAIIHNRQGGSVEISVRNSSIRVTNTSEGKPLDSRAIFQRFYKGTNQSSSTGLGLSIVKSITDHYKYTIRYDFNDMHTFTIDMN